MILIEETAIPPAALPVAEFKAHLRMGTGFSEFDLQDVVLESFLRAAMAAIEARTGKALITREFSLTLSAWRNRESEALPVAPVDEITALTLINRADEHEALDIAGYRLERDMQRPRLRALGGILPNVPSGGTVELRFIAGFGSHWGALPADLGQAVLLLAAHYYEFRHETSLGQGCMPFGVTSLIERYRTIRILGGGGQ